MSRQEQAALVAWINSFRPSRRVTAFEQLSDGRALGEVLNSIDSTHFKTAASKGPSAGPSSDNWVIKSNALKRLYRQLLSYPLPPPHHPLSTSTLPEPAFGAVVRAPTSGDGLAALVLLVRMALCLAVWAPGNERVIAKIQALGEGHMAELMRGIEEVMASMPEEGSEGGLDVEGGDAVGAGRGMGGGSAMARSETGRSRGSSKRSSPVKKEIRPSSPPAGLRAERDRLAGDNDELRGRIDKLSSKITDMTLELEEVKDERDDALQRLGSARETQASSLRTSQSASTEADTLRAGLHRAEDTIAKLEEDVAGKTARLADMAREVEDMRREVAEVAKLRDQLDEHKHAADKLQKSENVIEKYKKKLDESAGLRREMRTLEADNAQLSSTNVSLETQIRQLSAAKTASEERLAQLNELEVRVTAQANEITQLLEQLDAAQAHVEDLEEALEQSRAGPPSASGAADDDAAMASGTRASVDDIDARESLGEELGVEGKETRAQVRDLEARVGVFEASSSRVEDDAGGQDTQAARTGKLEALLQDMTRSRDRYRNEAMSAERGAVKLRSELQAAREAVATADAVSASGVSSGAGSDDSEIVKRLKDEVELLKERDRANLDDIRRLLQEKVELQSSGIDQREQALAREKEFGEIRASLAKDGASPEAQRQLTQLIERNLALQDEVERLRAMQDTRADRERSASDTVDGNYSDEESSPSPRASAAFELAQTAYETQIVDLRARLAAATAAREAVEARYKREGALMLSAWAQLGERAVREHVGNAVAGVRRSGGGKRREEAGWLGRQRRWVEEGVWGR